MSVAQDAFRATIEAGYYPEVGFRGRAYMCFALGEAFEAEVITECQLSEGLRAIRRVLDSRPPCMATALLGHPTTGNEDREWAVEHGVGFYTNWDERVKTLVFPEWIEDDDDYDR